MKKIKKISKIAALVLILAFLFGTVSTSENSTGESDTIYSDWQRPDQMPETGDGPDASSSGTRSAQGKSSNLADFLDSVEIAGAEKNAEGKYVIVEGVPYTIQMYFSEKINGAQFDAGPDGCVLRYDLPDGFEPIPASGNAEMTGDGGVVRFHYEISGNTLTVTFDTASPGYPAFLESETAQFEIHATGVISQEEIEFATEVIGEFDIDDEREVSVRKTGSYDAALNKIRYTVQAYSRGNNTDVHIGDILSGTALTYDPGSLTVTSDLSGSVVFNMDTRDGETFGLTIPSMAHGETVTIEYYADVDLDGVTDEDKNWIYGTVEETGNSVWITSHEDPDPDEKTVSGEDFDHKITLSTNSKTASSQSVRDGKTYVTWTIVLNEDANISIAGSKVTDTIDSRSQPFMRYSGTGLHIEKYEKDGTPAGTAEIQWGTDGLSASHGGSSWTYTIPSSDAENRYKYVITYETEVDSDVFLTTTTVNNEVHNEYDTDYSGSDVDTTGEEMEATKSAVHSTVDAVHKEAETEWEITFTVPPAGLDSAEIIDSLPGIRYPATNSWFYDTYKPGSVHVREGDLLEGEGFSVDPASQPNQILISFTKNGGTPGLNGTGVTRTIHVYLTTTASHEWLEYAESESRARNHTNNATVRINGQDIYVTGTVSYNTTAYELEKVMRGTFATSTEPTLPIYAYKIILTNVNDAAFDAEGYLTITDQYDPDYLVFHQTYQNGDDYDINTPNGHVYGNNQWNKEGMQYRGPYVVDGTSSEGQLVFKLNKNDLPMSGSSYYPYYAIVYALQIKDAETLARMKEEALRTDGLKVELKNTAWNAQFGTNTVVTDYAVEALDKKLVSEEDNSSTGTHDLHFRINVNPDGLKIGDEDTITLKDTLSYLSFDYTSIRIEPLLEGDVLDRVGSSIVFTLHNETPYTITYTARLIGIHDVHWTNKAVLFGRTSSISDTSSSQSGGSGSYITYSMNVKKYAEGNMNKGLAAVFELYEARVKDAGGNDIQEPVWEKVGTFTTDGTTGLFQIDKVFPAGTPDGRSLRPYSFHDGDGIESFGTPGSESYGWRYRVKEIEAPEGYQKTNTLYEFGISDIPSYAAPYNYLNNDTVTIVNKPIPAPADTEIIGEKVLVGKMLEDQEFTFSLSPEESVKAAWGDAYPGGFDGSLTAKNDAEGHFRFALSFTYDDYLHAIEKGYADSNQSAYFYYVVREELPEGVEGYFWNGVMYDESRFLVRIRLYVDGGKLITESSYYQYDGNWRHDEFLVTHS